MAKVTQHAMARVKERIGIKKSSVERIVGIVMDKGIRAKQATGRFRRYFECLYSHGAANNLIVHGNFVWVFSSEILITVLPLPKEHMAAAHKILGRRVNS